MPIIKLTVFDEAFGIVRDHLYRPISFNRRGGGRVNLTYTTQGFVRVVKPLLVRQNNFTEPIDNPLEPMYIDNSTYNIPTFQETQNARHT